MSRKRPNRALLVLTTLACVAAAPSPPMAQTATEELIAHEKLRESVEAVMQDHLSPAEDGKNRIEQLLRAVRLGGAPSHGL